MDAWLGAGLSGQRKDFQIAMLALWSSRPDGLKVLVFSPDVQRRLRELLPPHFGVEDSAVSAVKNTMATMEGFLLMEQEYEIAELREILTPER